MKKMFCVSALLGAVMLVATGASAARFGSYCEQTYEDGWQDSATHVWERCSRFNNELDDTDTRIMYRNLNNARDEFELDNDQNGLETVNLVFINTHGQNQNNVGQWPFDDDDPLGRSACWSMRNKQVRAWSKDMYLGNESYGLSILASYACNTHYRADGHLWERWSYTFKGGLRITVGSHDNLWGGYTTDECGEDFADFLQASKTVKYAWINALEDWKVDQDVMIMSAGETSSECSTRRDWIKWQNYTSYRRVRDGDVNTICWARYNNL